MSNNVFITNDNKGLLWELLENSFSNIEDSEYENFKLFFDNHIKNINEELDNKGIKELLDRNKFFIQNTINLITNNKWKEIYKTDPYMASDIKDKKMSEFEERFLQRQKEFNNLISIDKPKQLSFEDNMDKPIQNMEEELKKIQNTRQQSVTFDKNDEDNNFKKIKILEDKSKKKVTFNNIIDSIELDNSSSENNNNENNNIEINNSEINNIENNNIILILNNIQSTVKENNDLLRELINKIN